MEKSSPHKVAFLLSSFSAGGGERVMIELANGFAARGYAVDVLVLTMVGEYKTHVDSRIRIVSLDKGRMAFSLFPLISYLRREQPEVLLATDEYTHLLSLFARMFAGARTCIVLRLGNKLTEQFRQYRGKARLMTFLIRRLYKKADAIVANSHGVADDAIAVTGIDPTRVSVIFNPKSQGEILRKAQEKVEHPWLTHKTLPVILYAGRLRAQKNLDMLIRAFSRIVKNHPSRLVILGTGREEKHLRALVQELHVENSVSFPGYVDNPYAWMSKADVFVYPSLWEGLPNSLMEALVCGLAVISSDCDSGPRELLAPDSNYKTRLSEGVEYAKYGVLTAVGDESALAEAMLTMLNDKILREKYKVAGIERSSSFDTERIVDEYEKILVHK